jgi:hypothetical protein
MLLIKSWRNIFGSVELDVKVCPDHGLKNRLKTDRFLQKLKKLMGTGFSKTSRSNMKFLKI